MRKLLRGFVEAFSGWWRPRPAPVASALVVQPCALCLMPVEVPADYLELNDGDPSLFCCAPCERVIEEARVLYAAMARWEKGT